MRPAGGAGKLLRTTFRGLDIVVRYSHDTFLIVMPDTDQPQAEMALRRLTNEIDTWNLSNVAGLEWSGSRMASYAKGALIEDVVRRPRADALEEECQTDRFCLPCSLERGCRILRLRWWHQ